MTKYICLFLLFSVLPIFSQDILKDVKWEVRDNDTLYEKLNLEKKALIITIAHIKKANAVSKSIAFNGFFIVKHESTKDSLKTFEVEWGKGYKYFEMLNNIASKKYLSAIKQSDLDLKVYEHVSNNEKLQITFYQAKRYYTLYLENPKIRGRREKEKINQFLEFYKLIEGTWNITNTPKGRSPKE